MTTRERRSMTGAALLLAGAALIRYLAAPAPAEPPLAERGSVADSLHLAGDSARQESERRSRPFEPGETIDPNSATEEELDRLPGVGAARAAQIAADRAANGPFARAEDLARVSGIGPASVERMRPHLRFDPGLAARAGSGPRRGGGGARPPPRARIDVNRAGAEELVALPGIGPVTAARIVAYRAEHGRFRSPEQLQEVPGIGEATFARIAALVRAGR